MTLVQINVVSCVSSRLQVLLVVGVEEILEVVRTHLQDVIIVIIRRWPPVNVTRDLL